MLRENVELRVLSLGRLLYLRVGFFKHEFEEKSYLPFVDDDAAKVMKGQRPISLTQIRFSVQSDETSIMTSLSRC